MFNDLIKWFFVAASLDIVDQTRSKVVSLKTIRGYHAACAFLDSVEGKRETPIINAPFLGSA